MDVLIVDTTRANNGTAAAITNSVIEKHLGTAKLALVTRADQAGEFISLPAGTENRTLTGLPGALEAAQAVAEIIRKYAAEFDNAAFAVYSFHYRVLGKEGELALLAHPINTYSLRDHVPGRVGYQGSWPVRLMPLEDALEALEAALQQAQTPSGVRRAVLKTELRTLLTNVEPRFDKNRYPLAGTHRLISMLLHEAQTRGMVRLSGAEPSISIALQEAAVPADTTPSARGLQRAEPGAAPATAASAPTATPTAVTTASIPAQTHASAAQPGSANDTRSWHFANVLRQLRLGPYPEVRHDLYDKIVAITQENQDPSAELTVRTVARRAVAQVRSNAPEHFPRRNGDGLPRDRYDWRGLENFAVHVLSRTEMAVGMDGEPLPRETSIWTTRQAHVLRPLPEDIKVTFDAELVYEIVRACGNVTPEDIVHLAGAMLGGRGAQQTDHMENVLCHLLEQGRVTGYPGTEWLVATAGE